MAKTECCESFIELKIKLTSYKIIFKNYKHPAKLSSLNTSSTRNQTIQPNIIITPAQCTQLCRLREPSKIKCVPTPKPIINQGWVLFLTKMQKWVTASKVGQKLAYWPIAVLLFILFLNFFKAKCMKITVVFHKNKFQRFLD